MAPRRRTSCSWSTHARRSTVAATRARQTKVLVGAHETDERPAADDCVRNDDAPRDLRVEPIVPETFAALLGLALTILVALEVHKLWRRRRPIEGRAAPDQ